MPKPTTESDLRDAAEQFEKPKPIGEGEGAFQLWRACGVSRCEEAMRAHLPPSGPDETLIDAMRYAALSGGKRIRALLVLAASDMGERDGEALDQAMAAIEFMHAYSLAHDDLPCMDNDMLRRGLPTCHARYGEANAMLAGDALQTLAFETILKPTPLPAERRLRAAAVLAQASGARGMAMGQAVDLNHVGKGMTLQELGAMHALKTGALIRCAVLLGHYCLKETSETTAKRLGLFGSKLGLAFQIVDDALDATQSSQELGKTAGKDQKDGKPTYATLLGADGAWEKAKQATQEAIQALEGLDNADSLRRLAAAMLRRKR